MSHIVVLGRTCRSHLEWFQTIYTWSKKVSFFRYIFNINTYKKKFGSIQNLKFRSPNFHFLNHMWKYSILHSQLIFDCWYLMIVFYTLQVTERRNLTNLIGQFFLIDQFFILKNVQPKIHFCFLEFFGCWSGLLRCCMYGLCVFFCISFALLFVCFFLYCFLRDLGFWTVLILLFLALKSSN